MMTVSPPAVRLSAADQGPSDLAAHLRRHGPLPGLSGDAVLACVSGAGLTGRGGAAFPTGRKMRTVRDLAAVGRRAGRRPGAVIVANGCEGEPASAKDRMLLASSPHLVLDGIALAARAVGATRACLCVHGDEQRLLHVLHRAIAERAAAGIPGADVEIVEVPHTYVASEESALVRMVNGGPALPQSTPPRPFERGVEGRPTLVNNVETLAQIALIARYGPDWFRSSGTADAPGTALVTIGGAVRAPGVREIPLGINGADLLAAAGGVSEPVQAVLAGGYFGAWLPAHRFRTVRITPIGLTEAGAAMGAGIFLALPAASCGLAETARIARYLADQSAGQCGPCLNGLPAMADGLERLALRGDNRAPDYLGWLAPYVTGRGACRHPDGATRLIGSALRVFAADVRTHTGRGPCPGTRRAPILPVAAATPVEV